MVRLPRDVSAEQLCRALGRLGYRLDRQSGSHMTLVHAMHPEWQVGFPRHNPLKVGMLHAAISKVAGQLGVDQIELLESLKL